MIINKTIISTDILDVYLNFSKNNDYIKWVEVIDEKSNHLIKLTFKRDVINTYIYNKNKSVFEYLYNK